MKIKGKYVSDMPAKQLLAILKHGSKIPDVLSSVERELVRRGVPRSQYATL